MFYKTAQGFIIALLLMSTSAIMGQENDDNSSFSGQYWLDYNLKYSVKEKNELSGFVGYRSITPHTFNKFLVQSTYSIINEKPIKFLKREKPLIHSYDLGAGLFYTQNTNTKDNFEFRLVQGAKFFIPFIKTSFLNNYIRLEERFQKSINEGSWSTGLRIRYKIATAFFWNKHLFSFNKGMYIPMNVEVFFSLKESDRFNDNIRISPGIGYKFKNGWKTEFYVSYHNTKNTNSDGNTTNDLVFRLRVFRSLITSKTVNNKDEELKDLMDIE